MDWNKKLPLTQALLWIVVSMFFSVAIFSFYRKVVTAKGREISYEPIVSSIIQTGSHREALSTEYLAEILALSSDKPLRVKDLDCKKMEDRLLSSPLISQANVKLMKPGTLYIDYAVRQPVAFLEDYENTAIDRQGFAFPFNPFFSPKKLPSFYLGMEESLDWRQNLSSEKLNLCFEILSCVSDFSVCDQFPVQRIDVSQAFSPSYGRREVVVTVEDVFMRHKEGRDVEYHQKRFLRLHPKQFAKELANYLTLRKQLLETEGKEERSPSLQESALYLKDKVIDLRLDQLAFIRE